MQQKESYDVLRLIEHGQICYISSENVQGRTLARYLKYHPVMEKKEMFLLLKAIAEQLELIHRCRGNPCYQYVNPYSIILAEDGRVYFLDMKAETNRKQVVFMQRRDMREYFLPPEENYYQNASKELDIYGLGKTFQYILASSETGGKNTDFRVSFQKQWEQKGLIIKAFQKFKNKSQNGKKKLIKKVRETKENAGGRYISHYFSQWWRQGTC